MSSAGEDRAFLVEGRCELGPEGPRLLASQCARCRRYAFPARLVCPRCKQRSMAEAKLGQRGTLYSFTVCHVAPEGWRAPYFQAYIQLPEGLRVFSLVSSGVPPKADALRVGMEMELVVEPAQPGSELLTFKYRPREQDA
ncbi:MAG: Zn-ribbon domain-containing OB-fold protein [Solirubrobacteraceae bacterium]